MQFAVVELTQVCYPGMNLYCWDFEQGIASDEKYLSYLILSFFILLCLLGQRLGSSGGCS